MRPCLLYFLKLIRTCVSDHTWDLAAKRGEGGRSSSNFVIKCKFCGWENFIDVDSSSIGSYDHGDCDKWKTILIFECNGLVPVELSPRDDWVCQGYYINERSCQ